MKVEHAPADSTGYVQFKNVAKEREEAEQKKQEEEKAKKEVSVPYPVPLGLLSWLTPTRARTGGQAGQEEVGGRRPGQEGRRQLE